MTHSWKRADGSREVRIDLKWSTFGLGLWLAVQDLTVPDDNSWVRLTGALLFLSVTVDWYRGVK